MSEHLGVKIWKIALASAINAATQRKYMNYGIQTCGGDNRHSDYEGTSF